MAVRLRWAKMASRCPRANIRYAPPATEIPLEPGYGLLEMHPNGYGFLRSPTIPTPASAAIRSCPAR